MNDELSDEVIEDDSILKKNKLKPKKKAKKNKSKRTVRSYPASSFEEAFVLAEYMQKYSQGEKIRRLTLFKEINKSPTSGSSHMLITNSGKYGITVGSYVAEWIELTQEGKQASDQSNEEKLRIKAKFELAIENVPPFKALYDEYKGKKIPSHEVMKDFLQSADKKVDNLAECIDLFIVNVKYLGILQTIGGSEVVIPIENVTDEVKTSLSDGLVVEEQKDLPSLDNGKQATKLDLNLTCFYIAPIGEEGSESRKHSDLFLNSIVEPALKGFGLTVVRADKIGESGMITSQILEHLLKARLVIVDLSFHNPNVFYELAIRHATKLPIVQISRKTDKLPFDVDQIRTIQIDTTDIYSLVPKLETYRSEIATHVRQVLSNTGASNNPLSVFCPGFHVSLPK